MPSLTPTPSRDEFPAGASLWPDDLDRRAFIRLMGASVTLAGLSGCVRPPKAFVPYVDQPGGIVPGQPLFYATAMPFEGYARGILVETHEGRPTKIEGNPAHPESLGATDAVTQASILGLYDPDRSRAPTLHGVPVSWLDFEAAWFEQRMKLLATGGERFALLTEPTTSPTLRREIGRLLDRFPRARWYQHTPLARHDLDGDQADQDPGQADVILAIESDFLTSHPAALRYARAFAARRRVEHGAVHANRFYALEAGWSLTGAMADHRLAASPGAQRRVLDTVARLLAGDRDAARSGLSADESRFAASLAADLRAAAPRVLCLAGPEQAADVRRWAHAINRRLGRGAAEWFSPPVRSDADPRCAGDLSVLGDAMAAGDVASLVMLEANPAYTAAADVRFAERLPGVEFAVHLGTHEDETAALCRWHLPESHYLETWGDLIGYGGAAAIQQPLIEPLYGTRSAAEALRLLADGAEASGYDLVRETWQERAGKADFESRWTLWLNRGVVGEERSSSGRSAAPPLEIPALAREDGAEAGLTLLLRPDPFLADGRRANNGWLQELPRPFTSLVWDNALLVAPELAERRGWKNGDRVPLRRGAALVVAPVWAMPGQAPDCAVLHLGGGRWRAGTVGTGRGVSAYPLRTRAALWEIGSIACGATEGAALLVSTQRHFEMEGRDLVRVVPLQDLSRQVHEAEKKGTLYAPWPGQGHAWGMSIDLSTCLGCSACVAACQAENNTPVVGKEQVSRGREMHWVRLAAYFAGTGPTPRALFQPIPCMHCEDAPCELVCPVEATVHSSEGLNEMVYNRCVGTRYCSNNCPYKVRRFNFFDYRAPVDSPVHLQENPNVTVRARGVMEKCTYCVQRIDAAKIAAERENRLLRDGEIRTACQQACPVEAIVFGDLSDPASAVSRRKAETADYALLGELNTRPRTTYLPKIINENRG